MKRANLNPETMTPKQARKLLDEDAKFGIKVKAGKLTERLSTSARRKLESLAKNEAQNARNLSDLAARIGISRPTLRAKMSDARWPKANPDGSWNIEECRRALAAINTEPDQPDLPIRKPNPKDEAQTRKINLAIAREEHEFAISKRDYLPREEVNEALQTANTIVMRELTKALEHELPPQMEGMKAAEMQVAIHERLTEVFRHLPKKFKGLA